MVSFFFRLSLCHFKSCWLMKWKKGSSIFVFRGGKGVLIYPNLFFSFFWSCWWSDPATMIPYIWCHSPHNLKYSMYIFPTLKSIAYLLKHYSSSTGMNLYWLIVLVCRDTWMDHLREGIDLSSTVIKVLLFQWILFCFMWGRGNVLQGGG